MKTVFLCKSKEEAKLLSNKLKLEGLENEVIDSNFTDYGIQVNQDDYIKCLEIGTKIAKKEKYSTVYWVNQYDELNRLGFIPVAYYILPKNKGCRVASGVSKFSIYEDKDIQYFFKYLKDFLDVYLKGSHDYQIKYNRADNAIEVLFETGYDQHSKIVEACKIFNSHQEDIFCETVVYLEKNGKLIETPEKEKEENKRKGLNSYLYNSLFFEGLFHPEGNNISPKSDDEENENDFSGYKCSMSGYGVNEFDVKSISSIGDQEKLINGTFIAYLDKEYGYYWDNLKKEPTNLETKKIFSMIDNGEFETSIKLVSSTELNVNTKASIVRNVIGYNYDESTVRDGFFGNNNHKDSRFGFSINEYFKIISNNRLLHYSDASSLLEIYDMPEGFKLEDGFDINKAIYSNVYNENNIGELEKDEDYQLIKEILNERIEKGKSLKFPKINRNW